MDTAQETTDTIARPEDHWMTYEQAAELIGCSTKTIQRRVKAQEITPYLRHNSRRWWLKTEDVTALLIAV